ncbi:hypothetical protein EDB86DRAFT_573320 [Lactarius hatsudake]|nr:hypothetical protein EDB86DRAFT_573320 [Lactarius hatsudake]
MPRCVSSLLTTPVLGSPVVSGCDASLRFEPVDDACPRLSSPIPCVHALPSSLLMLTSSGLTGHHLILAVILIFKHATFLRLSNLASESALTCAELDYRNGNIDSFIQKYLTASSQEHSVELFAAFTMATDIESSVKNRV